MTLYITNVTNRQISFKLHNTPCIYDKKPEGKRYLKVEARKDLLECYFRSNAFAWWFYLCAPNPFIGPAQYYSYYYSMPFDVTLYFEEE